VRDPGDTTSFFIGRRWAAISAAPRAKVKITPERLATVESYFQRYGAGRS